MCGIAGYQGQFDPASLDAMSAVIAHRGPDDSGELIITGGMESVAISMICSAIPISCIRFGPIH